MNQYLKSLWLTETVRIIEKDSGRFHDEDINRQSRNIDGLFSDRVIKRAEIISQQNGFQSAQRDWLKSAKIALLILLLISVFTGAGLTFSALAQNPVNLYWALLCLLGFHLVTLFFWIISCIFFPNESGNFLIHIWLWLTKKLSQKNTTSQLLPAFIALFGKKIRWLVGMIVHLLWMVILFSALIILIVLLSTKSYSFEWQTTLLSADAVITITHFLGEIPAMLGFSIPDTETIRLSEQAISCGNVRSAWAIWLLGIFIVYGLFVRLILFVFCWLKWSIACQQITLNTGYPEYQLLLSELEPSSTKLILDEDTVNPLDYRKSAHSTILGSNLCSKNLLVAIDIDENWTIPKDIEFLGFLNNSEQRQSVLDYLQQHPAQKLLIAIDTNRAPDRGMMNLISLLISKSTQSKLWFINQGRQLQNWQESIKKLDIQEDSIDWL